MNKLLFLVGATLFAAHLNGNAINTSAMANTEVNETLILNDERTGVIRGTITGLEAQDTLMVRTQDLTDTVAVTNGVFEYKYKGSEVALVNFYCIGRKLPNGQYRAFRMSPISVLMFPNSSLDVKGNFEAYQISGNDFYTEYNKMSAPIFANDKKRSELSKEFSKIARSENPDKAKLEAIQTEFKQLGIDNQKMAVDYIASHLDSQVSAFLLYFFRPEAGEKYIDKISANVQNGALGNIYKETEKYYEKVAAKREAAKIIQAGKVAPNFTLKDLNGKDFSLSSLKGKYVVLDFWGSWCGWCIKGMPKMKEMYAKYKGKLEIVGIDCNDPESKWKAAVQKHGLPWINVINNPKGGTDLTNLYNISGFPTKIIVAPDGNIAKIVVGEDPAFYTAIDEYMK